MGLHLLRIVAISVDGAVVEACGRLRAQAGRLEGQPEIVKELARLRLRIRHERLVLQRVVAEIDLAPIVFVEIEHGGQMMRGIFDAVTAVEALRDLGRHHGHADIERIAPDVNDFRLGKGHFQQRQIHRVERHPVREERFARGQKAMTLNACEVVVTQQRCGVVAVRGPALRQVFRERLLGGQRVAGDFAQLAEKGEFAPRGERGVAAKDPLNERCPGAGQAHDENRLRHVAARLCAGHPLHVLAGEELFESSKQALHRIRLVLQLSGFRGKLAFGDDEVLPGLVIAPELLVQPAARKLRLSSESLRRVESCKRFLGAGTFPQEIGARQNGLFGRACRGATDELLRAGQLAPCLAQRRPGGERFRIGRREIMSAREQFPGLGQAFLLHEIVGEVGQARGRRLDLQRASQVPFSGRQLAGVGNDEAEHLMSPRVVRIHTQSGARDLFGVRSLTMGHQELDELVVGPVGPRVDANHGVKSTGGLTQLPASFLNLIAHLQGVDIAACHPQALLDCGLRGFDLTARERFASAKHQRVSGFDHESKPFVNFGQSKWVNPLWCLLHRHLFSAISRRCLMPDLNCGCHPWRWLLTVAVTFVLGTANLALAAEPTPDAVPLDVIPAPATVVPGNGVFAIRADTWISIPQDPGVARVARYFADLLASTRGVSLKVLQSDPAAADSPSTPALLFRLNPASATRTNPESYSVEVTPRQIVLSASDPRGLLYAAVTLWQLCTPKGADSAPIWIAAVNIKDSPRLAWRGLLLDSARHFQSPQFVMRFIDWMALHKLNVLNWHLTDDQAWRLEIKKYPRLAQVGAWRVPAGPVAAADIDPATGHPRLYGGFYSQDDVRRIVAHARERNVTIVPEIDMPGHASAAIVAYPQLGVTDHPPTAVPADWGVYSNLYNVDDSTFAFLDDVLDEVMALFPGEYVHVGGDEAVKDQWKASPRVQARMKELHIANEEALQSYFVQRIGTYLSAHGRRLVGWDEILEGGIPPGATIMSWRGLDGAVAAAKAGHDTVLSPSPTLYLDYRQSARDDEPPGRGRVSSLREVYDFDPMPASIDPTQREHVLGLQANIWTEHVRTEDRVAYMTFPRAAAIAEVGWSQPSARDWSNFVRRLPSEFDRYRALGIHYSEDAFRVAQTASALGPFERHPSADLRTCTDKLVLWLEDDAPLRGDRAVFLIDIMNPCWIFPGAELGQARTFQAAVGQVPFNFQLGKDRDAIHLASPRSAAGELEVHLDTCDGARIAVLPLAPAAGNNAVTVLPAVRLGHEARGERSGRHDLCLRFTQRTLDPMWALDWVQLQE